jgi:hypothetical protein
MLCCVRDRLHLERDSLEMVTAREEIIGRYRIRREREREGERTRRYRYPRIRGYEDTRIRGYEDSRSESFDSVGMHLAYKHLRCVRACPAAGYAFGARARTRSSSCPGSKIKMLEMSEMSEK